MRFITRTALLLTLLIAAGLFSRETAEADPGIGTSASFAAPAFMGAILEPAPGAPMTPPPALPPPIMQIVDLAALPPSPLAPGMGQVQDFSYGDETLTIGVARHIEFSTAPGDTGHPGSPPPGPHANVRQEEAVFAPPPFGDGSAAGDIFINWPGPVIGPLPCGPIGSNAQLIDGDGAFVAPFVPRLGSGMPEPAPNLDGYERLDETFVDFLPSPTANDGLPDAPVFFTIDAATAAGWPGAFPLPNAFGPASVPTPSDIIVWDPVGFSLVIWAVPPMLGLLAGDDIDALAVSWSGAPVGAGLDAASEVVFSLAPGSPSLAATSGGIGAAPFPQVCSAPGLGTAADLYYVAGFAAPIGYVDAEQLGLNTARSGGGADDNLDALDTCLPVGGDVDGDTIDDACDYDSDGDGVGNFVDNCALVAGPQTNTDSAALDGEAPPLSGTVAAGADTSNPHGDATGDICDSDDDNDGLSDAAEPAGCNGSGALSTTDFDFDNDLYPDGYECTMGTNPGLASSRPAYPAGGDADGDGLNNAIEIMVLTSGGPTNFDGGNCGDRRENASNNADTIVSSADLSAVAMRATGTYRNTGPGVPTPGLATGEVIYARQIYDFNRDGLVSSADLSGVAQAFVVVSVPQPC